MAEPSMITTPPEPPPGELHEVGWGEKLRQTLTVLVRSEIGLSFVIAGLSMGVIAAILCGYYLSASTVLKSNISTRDIVAERLIQVEDVAETNHLRYEAKQLVAPIYKHEIGIQKQVINNLITFLEEIHEIRGNETLTWKQKQVALKKLNPEKSVFSPSTAETLLATPRWQNLSDASLRTMELLMAQGVTTEQFRLRKNRTIAQNMPKHVYLTPQEQAAVIALVGLSLRPNLIMDEQSTEEARDIAAGQVRPVMTLFKKGEMIVRQGETFSPVQRAALQQQGHLSTQSRWLTVLGIVILTVSLLSIVWGYLYRFEHSNFFKPAYAGLLATTMSLAVMGLVMWVDMVQPTLPVELYPLAILSLAICLFTHARIAIMATMIVLLLCGLTLRIPLDSLATLVISSLVAIFVLSRKPIPKDRNDVILAGLGEGLAKGAVILALGFISGTQMEPEMAQTIYRFWLGLCSGVFTGLITPGLLSVLEGWFKLVTPFTLLELANHDRPILRRLQLEAPGTFHHSVMVATLSEAGAEAIGANPILTRVGSLYHDIGKIKRPLFFVENQAYFGIENPHDKLSPRLSKMVITAHPRDGIEMAKQLGLPKVIMRFMPEHHGTLIAGYFYNKALIQEGEDHVNKAQFRYPGPKPQSKETAIVMLADACESSVRALKNPTLAQIEDRVDKIIKQRVDDQQFSECPLTFQDLKIVRDVFIRILRGIQHTRIEYQQNVLEELGKKSPLDTQQAIQKQLTQQLAQMQTQIQPNGGKLQPSAPSSHPDLEPVLDLDALALLQEEEKTAAQATEKGPDCC